METLTKTLIDAGRLTGVVLCRSRRQPQLLGVHGSHPTLSRRRCILEILPTLQLLVFAPCHLQCSLSLECRYCLMHVLLGWTLHSHFVVLCNSLCLLQEASAIGVRTVLKKAYRCNFWPRAHFYPKLAFLPVIHKWNNEREKQLAFGVVSFLCSSDSSFFFQEPEKSRGDGMSFSHESHFLIP